MQARTEAPLSVAPSDCWLTKNQPFSKPVQLLHVPACSSREDINEGHDGDCHQCDHDYARQRDGPNLVVKEANLSGDIYTHTAAAACKQSWQVLESGQKGLDTYFFDCCV